MALAHRPCMVAKPLAALPRKANPFGGVEAQISGASIPMGAFTIEEARALESIDDVLLPEDVAGLPTTSPFLRQLEGQTAADDLRLPPPSSGSPLKTALTAVVGLSRRSGHASAPKEMLEAEARLIAVASGILRLQEHIQEQSRPLIDASSKRR